MIIRLSWSRNSIKTANTPRFIADCTAMHHTSHKQRLLAVTANHARITPSCNFRKMAKLTEDVVKEILGAFPAPVVLNFSNQRLQHVSNLECFPSVRILDLSSNEVW